MTKQTNFLEKLLDGAEVEWLPLGALGELVRGNGLPKSDFTDTGIPAIHYGQIYTYYGLYTNSTISFVSKATAKKLKKVNNGDVVITNTSENFEDVGTPLVYLGEEDAVTGGHATIFKPHGIIINKYFAYFTQTSTFYKAKRKYAKGTKVIDVSAKDMSKILIPIPCPNDPQKSLAIQNEIVRILDTFTATTAELTAELSTRKQQYQYYRDNLLTFADNEVEWKNLGKVIKIKNGKDWKHLGSGNIPVYGSGGVMQYVDSFVYDKPTVLIPRKGSITNIFYLEEPFWNVDTIYYTEINIEQLTPKFFFYFMTTLDLMKLDTGSGRPSLTQAILNQILIPIPPLNKQAEIVAILDKFDTLTNSISEGLPKEIELRQKQYEYYREMLLNFPKPEAVEA